MYLISIDQHCYIYISIFDDSLSGLVNLNALKHIQMAEKGSICLNEKDENFKAKPQIFPVLKKLDRNRCRFLVVSKLEWIEKHVIFQNHFEMAPVVFNHLVAPFLFCSPYKGAFCNFWGYCLLSKGIVEQRIDIVHDVSSSQEVSVL